MIGSLAQSLSHAALPIIVIMFISFHEPEVQSVINGSFPRLNSPIKIDIVVRTNVHTAGTQYVPLKLY